MPKYRKKPVVIEAFQMTLEARWDNVDWPNWLNKAWNLGNSEEGAVFPKEVYSSVLYPSPKSSNQLSIYTLEGKMTVAVDDWIIQGISGELYPCKPNIFEESYELVN